MMDHARVTAGAAAHPVSAMRLLRLLTSLVLLAGAARAQPPPLRPLAPEDLLAVERIDEVVPSPDGADAAVVVLRARSAASTRPRFLMGGYDRADVWLVRASEGEARAISDGARDGVGFYYPTWSPDGARLALLSTRGDGVRVWIWERANGTLRPVTRGSVEHARPVWRSSTHLLCAAPAQGQAPLQVTIDTAAARHLMSAWPRAFDGTGSTGSVVRSGDGPALADPRLDGELLEIDVRDGQSRVIATGSFTALSVSPDGRWLAAALASTVIRPPGFARLPNVNPVRYGLAIHALDGPQPSVPAIDDIAPASLRWSPETGLLRVDRYDQLTEPARPLWLAHQGTSFRVVSSTGEEQGGPAKAVVTAPAPPAGATVAWPREGTEDGPVRLLRRVAGTSTEWLVQDVSRGDVRGLPSPPGAMELAAFSPRSATAYFREASRSGSRLYISRAGGVAARVVLERNTFLASVAEGTLRRLHVPAPDGSSSVAWLLLPPGAAPGRRHPTVVWVYGGLVYGESPPPYFVPLNSAGTLNLQVLAARGYAVLLPSIPMGPEHAPAEPLTEISSTVLRAVDAAIAAGDVDGSRLAVMGHSFGGYAAYGIVTQTNRFRAAVALAGASNLVSLYGQFDARFRHLPTARDRLLAMVFTESGQYRMGAPLDQDVDRYLRNSPVTHANRVTTPTMIVQGDLDYVPIQQGEEFFTALYRRGVPAQFVRYWGEGHTIESPPNVVDMWAHILKWLGTHLAPR